MQITMCLVFFKTREDAAEIPHQCFCLEQYFRENLKTNCRIERSGDALMRCQRLILNTRWLAVFPCKALGGRLGAVGTAVGVLIYGSLDILADNLKMLVETDLIEGE